MKALMFNHIIFLKVKNPAEIPRVRDALLSLQEKIPQLKHAEVGIDILKTPRSFDMSFIARFDSRGDFEAYSNHPAHNPVADLIHSLITDAAAVDYEG